jgi:hypothetical protein
LDAATDNAAQMVHAKNALTDAHLLDEKMRNAVRFGIFIVLALSGLGLLVYFSFHSEIGTSWFAKSETSSRVTEAPKVMANTNPLPVTGETKSYSELLTRDQWRAIITSEESEKKFQQWRNSQEFSEITNEFATISSSARQRGDLLPEEANRLRFYIKHHDWGTRVYALVLAADLAQSETIRQILLPDILYALEDKSPHVRRAAVYALGRIGNAEIVPILEASLLDPEPAVQKTAEKAIEKLQQKNSRKKEE